MEKELRIRGSESHYAIVDYLKGCAILSIVTMHLLQMYIPGIPDFIKKALSFGGTGGQVFFLCSGFGLYLSQKKQYLNFSQFVYRRMRKIYIPYIIVVLISSIFPFMYSGEDKFEALLSHIFLYKMFVGKYEETFGGQLWFISTMFQLYILFIPLCFIKEKLGNKLFEAICLGVSVIWWLLTAWADIANERIWGSFCLQYLWEFALGMIIADYLSKGKEIKVTRNCIIVSAVFGTSVASIMVICGGILKIINDPISLIGYVSIMLLLYMCNIKGIKQAMLALADISYEWYLVHILVFSSMFHYISAEGIKTYLGGIAFIVSIIVAFIYNKCIGYCLNRKMKFALKGWKL